jgi:hypothetical protein
MSESVLTVLIPALSTIIAAFMAAFIPAYINYKAKKDELEVKKKEIELEWAKQQNKLAKQLKQKGNNDLEINNLQNVPTVNAARINLKGDDLKKEIHSEALKNINWRLSIYIFLGVLVLGPLIWGLITLFSAPHVPTPIPVPTALSLSLDNANVDFIITPANDNTKKIIPAGEILSLQLHDVITVEVEITNADKSPFPMEQIDIHFSFASTPDNYSDSRAVYQAQKLGTDAITVKIRDDATGFSILRSITVEIK